MEKSDDAGKPVWIMASELIYGQVKKIVRRRRLVRVEHTMLLGEQQNLKDRAKFRVFRAHQYSFYRKVESDHSTGGISAGTSNLGKGKVFIRTEAASALVEGLLSLRSLPCFLAGAIRPADRAEWEANSVSISQSNPGDDSRTRNAALVSA